MYYFYILRCRDKSLYCGQTNNLEKRLKEHNSNSIKGAKYTRGRGPVRLIYFESYPTLQAAMTRETEVKKWPKIKKERLVNNQT